jgi:hypothetical protein
MGPENGKGKVGAGRRSSDRKGKGRPKFIDADVSKDIMELAKVSAHRPLSIWAVECAGRVMPLFESVRPEDGRPREAMATLEEWLQTGQFSMGAVRKASLASHAAAREMEDATSAHFAARAAGQAVASAHARMHSIAAAWYAAKAVWAIGGLDAPVRVRDEREWQYRRLQQLIQEHEAAIRLGGHGGNGRRER